MTSGVLQAGDEARAQLGYRTVGDTARLREGGVQVLDPFSTLVSPEVVLEPGVILYPTVVLRAAAGGRIAIGAGTVLWPGVVILAEGGRVDIGLRAEIGLEGGFAVTAAPGANASIGARARLTGGGVIQETGSVGDGAQILGRIAVRGCTLEGGGDHTEPDPDRRGAVLKGFGQARHLALGRGRVIQAFGIFDLADARPQSFFHPPASA